MEGTSPALFFFSSFLLLLPTSFALDILKACLGSTTPSLSLQVSRSCVAWSMFDKTIWVKAICRRKKTKTTKKNQTDPISVQRDKDKGAQPPTCASHSHLQEEKAACLHTYISLARKKKIIHQPSTSCFPCFALYSGRAQRVSWCCRAPAQCISCCHITRHLWFSPSPGWPGVS